MFWQDHPPPHFHVRYAGFRARIGIAELTLVFGNLPPTAYRLVLQRARLHQAELMENWMLYQQQTQPKTIEPLP